MRGFDRSTTAGRVAAGLFLTTCLTPLVMGPMVPARADGGAGGFGGGPVGSGGTDSTTGTGGTGGAASASGSSGGGGGGAASTNVATATQLYFRYDGDIGSGTDNHALNVGLRLSW